MTARRQFAEGTTVPVETSRMEIERLVTRRGASNFASGWGSGRAVLGFVIEGRALRFELPLPDKGERRFRTTASRGLARSDEGAAAAHAAELRRVWRALALSIKAKFEAVASGIVTFEEEFLPHFVVATPDGPRRFADIAVPALRASYESGHVPPLQLSMGGDT